MPLHPQVQAMRDRRQRDRAPQLYTLTVEEARAADLADIQAAAGSGEPVAEIVNRTISGPGGELPIRIYRPAPGELPVLVYLFGGGWTLGTVDTSDAVCRRLANAVGCMVVAVGYRLAPEHKFPAPVLDCAAAVQWIAGNAASIGADGGRIAVAGDSAGGNLAAAVTLLCRDSGGPRLAAQVLVYPNTHFGAQTVSVMENRDPYLFNSTSVNWYWDNYLTTPEDGRDPLASPLRAEHLRDLPPALVITAEFDPLRDEAEAYARRLADDGVQVELTRYDGMIHGFFCMAGEVEAGRHAQTQAATFLHRHLFPA